MADPAKKKRVAASLSIEEWRKSYPLTLDGNPLATLYAEVRQCESVEEVLEMLWQDPKEGSIDLERLEKWIRENAAGYPNVGEYEDELRLVSLVIFDHLRRMIGLPKGAAWRTNEFRECVLLPLKYLGDVATGEKPPSAFHGTMKRAREIYALKYYYEDAHDNPEDEVIKYLEGKGYEFPFDDLEAVTASGIYKRKAREREDEEREEAEKKPRVESEEEDDEEE